MLANQAQIDNRPDTHFGKGVEPCVSGLSAAIYLIVDLKEIRQACHTGCEGNQRRRKEYRGKGIEPPGKDEKKS
jgi:hypothetical protein